MNIFIMKYKFGFKYFPSFSLTQFVFPSKVLKISQVIQKLEKTEISSALYNFFLNLNFSPFSFRV